MLLQVASVMSDCAGEAAGMCDREPLNLRELSTVSDAAGEGQWVRVV